MAATDLPGWPRGLSAELAAAYVGVSTSAVYAMRKTGDFPQPMWITPGRLVWLREDLDAWLDIKAGRVQPRAPRPEEIA